MQCLWVGVGGAETQNSCHKGKVVHGSLKSPFLSGQRSPPWDPGDQAAQGTRGPREVSKTSDNVS